ncbi:hypothetical protein FQZ97_861650 [compost metagenome]
MCVTTQHVIERLRAALVRDVVLLQAKLLLEKCHVQMVRRPHAGRRIGVLAGLGPNPVDVLLHRADFHRGMSNQHHGRRADFNHGRQVLQRVEGCAFENARRNGEVGVGCDDQRMAIRIRLGRLHDAKRTPNTRTVVDDDRLTQPRPKVFRDQPGNGVHGAARNGRGDQRHRFGRKAGGRRLGPGVASAGQGRAKRSTEEDASIDHGLSPLSLR